MSCLKLAYIEEEQSVLRCVWKSDEHQKSCVNWYDYGARMYDAALGRFFTQDRFAEKYIDFSPYQYAANNPMLYIDINGDSLWISHKGNDILYENGNLYNKDGTAYSGKGVKKNGKLKGFLKKAVGALDEISSETDGASLLSDIQSSTENVTIVKGSGNNYKPENNNWRDATNGTEVGGTVNWNTLNKDALGAQRPGFVGLAHELDHGLDAANGTVNGSTWFNVGTTPVYKAEQYATHWENRIRAEHGLPLRTHYQPGYSQSRIIVSGTSQSTFVPSFDYVRNHQ